MNDKKKQREKQGVKKKKMNILERIEETGKNEIK